MRAIAHREFLALFRTPAGWLLAAGSTFTLAWWYLTLLERYRRHYEPALVKVQGELGATDLIVAPFLGGLPLLTLLLTVTAALAMRQCAGTRRGGALDMLLASPLGGLHIAAGQFAGALAYLSILLVVWLLMPATLGLMTTLDWGRLAAAALGLWLTAAMLLAVGLAAASVSRQPGVGGVLSFGIGLLLMLVGSGAEPGGAMHWLALGTHYQNLLRGTLTGSDLAYYVALGGTALIVSALQLERLRET